jgi:hypothetical protein
MPPAYQKSGPAAPAQPSAGEAFIPGLTPGVFSLESDNDGKKDLLVARSDGAIMLYQNGVSDTDPQLNANLALMADGEPIAVPGPGFVAVLDWDGNGSKDVLVGDGQGSVRWYRNTGTDDSPVLTFWDFLLADDSEIQVTGPAAPVVVDWNSDGRKDLLLETVPVICGSS